MFRIQTFFPQNGKDINSYFGIILMLTELVESLSTNYDKVRWNYYKLRQLFYYKVRHGLLQLRQVLRSAMDLLQIAIGVAK